MCPGNFRELNSGAALWRASARRARRVWHHTVWKRVVVSMWVITPCKESIGPLRVVYIQYNLSAKNGSKLIMEFFPLTAITEWRLAGPKEGTCMVGVATV